ncbi:unnamed protein product, partial [marine sediment metagenome]
MSWDTFTKILLDLKSLNYKGAIHPYLMSEPLTDKGFDNLVMTIRKIFPRNRILINTNGDYLKSVNDVRRLINIGLTDIIINLYDKSNEHLVKASGIKQVKINRLNGLRRMYYNRGGLVNERPIRKRPKGQCDYVLSKMYINYLGDIILCCSDYLY